MQNNHDPDANVDTGADTGANKGEAQAPDSGRGGREDPRPFAWSFSRLTAFEQCPRRFFHLNVRRDVREEVTEQVSWGMRVHEKLATALKARASVPLEVPSAHKAFEMIQRISTPDAKLLLEEKFAVDERLKQVDWASPQAWLRGIVDAAVVGQTAALAVDWKTGAKKPKSEQLGLMAVLLFAAYPELKVVNTAYVWLREASYTCERFTRQDAAELIERLRPRVEAMEAAMVVGDFPPNPSGLCRRHCPVTMCAYNGRKT